MNEKNTILTDALQEAIDIIESLDGRDNSCSPMYDISELRNVLSAAQKEEQPQASNAQNAADAKRYRFLVECKSWPKEVNAQIDCGVKAGIDAAIDAALSAKESEHG